MEKSFEALVDGANKWKQARCVCALLWVSVSIGAGIGLTAVQCDSIINGRDVVEMSQGEVVWLASIFSIFVVGGQISGGLISNGLGRKVGCLVVCPIFLVGFLCGGLGQSVGVIYASKAVHGVACGMQHTSVASYLSEVTSPSLRASVHCAAGVIVTVGVSLPVLATNLGLHWRHSSLIFSSLPVLGFLHILTIPESPHWLVMKGRSLQALQALMRLRGADYDCVRERDHLQTSYRRQTTSQHTETSKTITERMRDPDIWKPFLIVNLMFLIQVGTGVPLLTFFVISIMRASGTRIDPNLCALLERGATVLGQLLASLASYKLTRRLAWTVSSTMLCISWLGLASTVQLTASGPLELFSNSTLSNNSSQTPVGELGPGDYLPPVLFVLLRLSFQMSLGPFPWIYGNELYPLDLRSYLCAVTSSLEPVQQFIMVTIFPLLCSSLGLSNTFFLFSSMAFISVLFGIFVLPETKGKTLSDINKMFYTKNIIDVGCINRSKNEEYSKCPQ